MSTPFQDHPPQRDYKNSIFECEIRLEIAAKGGTCCKFTRRALFGQNEAPNNEDHSSTRSQQNEITFRCLVRLAASWNIALHEPEVVLPPARWRSHRFLLRASDSRIYRIDIRT
jgi:hypothetical protein